MESPRATFENFLAAIEDAYGLARAGDRGGSADALSRATTALDLSQLPGQISHSEGIEIALMLKEVLDRLPRPAPESFPQRPANEQDAGSVADLLSLLRGADAARPADRWTMPGTEITIARATEGPKIDHYLFSPETVRRAPEFLDRVAHLPYRAGATEGIYHAFITTPGRGIDFAWGDRLPAWMSRVLWGQTVWQWMAGLSLVGAVGALAMHMLRPAIHGLWQPRADGAEIRTCGRAILGVAGAVVLTRATQHVLTDVINVTGLALVISADALILLRFLLAGWLVALAVALAVTCILARLELPRRSPEAHLIGFAGRVVSIGGIVVVIVLAAQEVGLPVYSVVTGLGIGGLAVAFAAQQSLSAIFGSIMIMLDRPFRVGDYIALGEKEGVVENIGFRSTHIRTPLDAILAVPNSEMATATIVNFGSDAGRPVSAEFEIREDTRPAEIESFLEGIRAVIVDGGASPARAVDVALGGFGSAGLTVSAEFLLDVPDRGTERVERQRIVMGVLILAERLGIAFAPNQALDVSLEQTGAHSRPDAPDLVPPEMAHGAA